MIEAALAESQGRVSGPAGAAAKLGLPARTLDSKIKRLKIKKISIQSPTAPTDPQRRLSSASCFPHQTGFLKFKDYPQL